MAVPPRPIFFLFFGWKASKIPVRIAMRFTAPPLVKHYFVLVPHVVIGVIGVIDPIVVVAQAVPNAADAIAPASKTDRRT